MGRRRTPRAYVTYGAGIIGTWGHTTAIFFFETSQSNRFLFASAIEIARHDVGVGDLHSKFEYDSEEFGFRGSRIAKSSETTHMY